MAQQQGGDKAKSKYVLYAGIMLVVLVAYMMFGRSSQPAMSDADVSSVLKGDGDRQAQMAEDLKKVQAADAAAKAAAAAPKASAPGPGPGPGANANDGLPKNLVYEYRKLDPVVMPVAPIPESEKPHVERWARCSDGNDSGLFAYITTAQGYRLKIEFRSEEILNEPIVLPRGKREAKLSAARKARKAAEAVVATNLQVEPYHAESREIASEKSEQTTPRNDGCAIDHNRYVGILTSPCGTLACDGLKLEMTMIDQFGKQVVGYLLREQEPGVMAKLRGPEAIAELKIRELRLTHAASRRMPASLPKK